MTISNYFNKTATLTKKTQTSQNSRGEPLFSTATSSLSCAIQPNTGRTGEGYNVVDRGKVTISTHMLFCAITETISEGDTVTDGSDIYNVLLVSDDAGRGHHLLAYLRQVA